MVKKHTTLNIDSDVIDEAKQKFINISEVAEKALKAQLGKVEVTMNEEHKCEFCGKEEKKATAENPIGLTWLYPDERWLCNSCLLHKSKSAGMTGA